MSKRLSNIGFVLFVSMLTMLPGNAQESEPVSVRDCFDEETFHYTGGKYNNAEIKYRLHKPENIRSDREYPLIVHLHGWGESGSNNTSSLIHLHSILPLLTGSESEDFFMLVTQCPTDAPGWSFRSSKDGTLDVLMAVMEHVVAEYPIDEKRISATGISSGGWGVWELLMRYPDTFAGAVPTSCGAPSQLQRLTALKQTKIWAFVNKGDARVNAESIPIAMHAINNSGGSMAFTECNAPGHNAWNPAMENYQGFRWMLAQKKGNRFSPPPGTIVHQPNSWLFILVMCIVPLAIIVFFAFLSWGKIYVQVSDTWQTIRERTSS